jgi:RND family efflux transporter MFP subunit
MAWIKPSFVCGMLCVCGLGGPLASASDLETAPVTRVDLPRVYRLDGVAEAISRGTVSAQTSGRVLEVNFDVDDYVRRGEVIVVLEDREQRVRVDQARANLEAATVKHQDIEKEFRRIEGVFAKQAVSKADMDKVTAALKQARAAERAVEAALQEDLQQLEYTRVKAPYNGIVTERHIEVGEAAQPGQALMSGLSLDRMRISVDVPQNLVDLIRAERKARAKIGGKWLLVEDVTVFPVADPRSNTFEVRLQLPPGIEGVFPGMYIQVGFFAGSQQTLAVPLSSVVLRSEVVGVYVVNGEGQVHLRHIRIGSPAGLQDITVLSGLDEGERVAIDPVAAGILLKSQRTARLSNE